ncbi:hypothetical protein [Streptomyces sp. or20]|uniref:hypothetical protein n=1 Tax=Streptomyces sp. or20 TaxID=1828016 RepID=UPI000BF05F43|nr:hypothetical protein [Streptomyces sp. or20]
MTTPQADAIAAELHRRTLRLDELSTEPAGNRERINHVRGEVIGLRGALGIALGGSVPGGSADPAGAAYYQEWLNRQEPDG